ncbi:MAG TPA: hypothetical protein PKG52_12955 [bacterium]|nr:hypothetical protein [bacterium]
MKRKCVIMKKEWLEGIRINTPAKEVSLYYDCANEAEIKEIFEDERFKKKLQVILFYILNGKYDDDLYDFEVVSEKAKGVTAMKFKGGKYDNLRIICKEYYQNDKKIVAVTAVKKKTQKVNKQLKELYERIGGYEYEFKD